MVDICPSVIVTLWGRLRASSTFGLKICLVIVLCSRVICRLILYIMEGYLQGSDDNEDTQFTNDCDDIFAKLEGVVDTYYGKNEDD